MRDNMKNISTNPCYIDCPNENGVNKEYWLYYVNQFPMELRFIFAGTFKTKDEAEKFIVKNSKTNIYAPSIYYEIKEITTIRPFLK